MRQERRRGRSAAGPRARIRAARALIAVVAAIAGRARAELPAHAADAAPNARGDARAEAAETGSGGTRATTTRARLFLAAGQPREAMALLKPAVATLGREAALLLAQAYLDDSNDFWAMRVLLAHLALHPEDCEARSWLVFAQLKQGSLDDANETLGGLGDCLEPRLVVRRRLLEATVAAASSAPEAARESLSQAARQPVAFPEDRKALTDLRASVEPNVLWPVSARLESSAGWTSNALAGSPVDPEAARSDASSPMAALNASLRLVAPLNVLLRPSLEVELRSVGNTSGPGRDLSHAQLAGRAGVVAGRTRPWFLGYRYEGLAIAGGDRYEAGPLLFSDAHRAEFEGTFPHGLTSFGGAGRRNYRDLARSRFETDLGFGALRRLGRGSLTAAVLGRLHDARRAAWDGGGGAALVSAEAPLPKRASARIGLVGGIDSFPHSAGFFGDAARQDRSLKVSASLWTARFWETRLGFTYDGSRRWSSATRYAFLEHRVTLKLQWASALDPFGPRPEAPPDHVPLAWTGASGAAPVEETVQDLLRQDDSVRRGSACVE